MYHLKNIFKALSKGSCPFNISVLQEAKKHLDSKDDFRPVAEVVLPKLEEQEWLEAMETFFRMFSQEPGPACGLDLIEMAKQVYNHWSDGFLGGSLQALKWTLLVNEALIRAAESNDLLQEYYSKSLNLLQSSGTGKSKLLDELAKDNFTFTFVSRKESDTGFPPGDNDISRFLSNRSKPA